MKFSLTTLFVAVVAVSALPGAPVQKRENCGNGDFDICCDFDTGCRYASTCLLECTTGDVGGDLGCIAACNTICPKEEECP
ncbi:hypothetical protein KVR01_009204 [Diaporthe batatas]|uniref:uncharacterized protein n=1 Tax=Diaporthe batatas TaxID=748121 RepID=UPI001D03FD37|nr:uncharacterized protein KVR01_009204 [Diaporthe batatas]KAG8160940.1 hypothetical protein KVR01_009204 [Diaporthe batatas]